MSKNYILDGSLWCDHRILTYATIVSIKTEILNIFSFSFPIEHESDENHLDGCGVWTKKKYKKHIHRPNNKMIFLREECEIKLYWGHDMSGISHNFHNGILSTFISPAMIIFMYRLIHKFMNMPCIGIDFNIFYVLYSSSSFSFFFLYISLNKYYVFILLN